MTSHGTADAEHAGNRVSAALRWCAAGLTVIAVHGGVAWSILSRPIEDAAPGDPSVAITIDLAPVAVADEARPQPDVTPDPAPQPDVTPPPASPEEIRPEPPPVEPPPEVTPPEATPTPQPTQATPAPPPPQDVTPPPEFKAPAAPQAPTAEAVLPPPPPQPVPVEAKPQASAKARPPRPKHRPTPRPKAEPQRSAAVATPTPSAPAAPAISPATWKGTLVAHLNRFKRFPPGASQGTASVAFTISRSGQVLSARLVGSSGDTALDAEAVAMVNRASPVPAPPAGFGGGSITLTVPVRFSR